MGLMHVPRPHHWAQAASFGVRAVAGVGTAAISATRTKAFFQKVNEEYLNPRGLKASLKKDEEVAAQLGLPADMPVLGYVYSRSIEALSANTIIKQVS